MLILTCEPGPQGITITTEGGTLTGIGRVTVSLATTPPSSVAEPPASSEPVPPGVDKVAVVYRATLESEEEDEILRDVSLAKGCLVSDLSELARHDPHLVRAVLAEPCSDFKVEWLPSGTRYFIDTYDGSEYVRTYEQLDWKVASQGPDLRIERYQQVLQKIGEDEDHSEYCDIWIGKECTCHVQEAKLALDDL